ncbi:MAG: hypothetical protein QUU85_12295, partial [Candidatus Eisenbacteria bacterium]|nr:hypothetical protein [Candidatus Eisenbacteria bacterium]
MDLGSAPSGPYDLEAALPGGDTISVRPALFLGAPEVIRVPEDQPSIFEAIDAAPPCAEIQVAERAWVGNLVLDKPLRLRGVPNGYLLPVVRPSVPLSPVVRILEEAGPLAVVESLQISDGMAGGILCEAPAMLRGNRVVDNDGPKGAGIYAASGGARILGNLVFDNDAGEGGEPANLWSTDPGIAGVAGGLFCLDCWLEGNDIAHNSAQSCAGLVADGVIRDNRVQENWPGFAWLGRWRMGAVRGEVTGNRFDNCCGSDTPYLFAEGPTRIENNDFTDVSGMMCAMPENVHLKGSFDLIGNRFLGAGLQACLAVDGVREASAGHFRMVGNAFASDMPIHLYLDPSEGICVKGYGDEPWAAIPEDSLFFRCNATESESFRLYLHRAGGDVTECDSCLYVPGDSEPDPPGCPETFPDIEDICEFSPVLVQDARVEGTPEGVRLLWSMPGDVDPEGFDVQRASGGTSVRLNAERLPACERCEFLDTAPPRLSLIHISEPTRQRC